MRLPPPHQRLGEVNFQIVPDAELTFESEGEHSSESEEAPSEDERVDAEAEAEDEDMEEVGVDEPLRQERKVDEDYDE